MSTTARKRKRSFSSWKQEVWVIIHGLPLTRAAEVIKRIADDSLREEEITRRTYERALDWADRIYWRVKPE